MRRKRGGAGTGLPLMKTTKQQQATTTRKQANADWEFDVQLQGRLCCYVRGLRYNFPAFSRDRPKAAVGEGATDTEARCRPVLPEDADMFAGAQEGLGMFAAWDAAAATLPAAQA